MEATPSVKAMVIAAKQYLHKSNSTNLSNLLRQLDILISITGRGTFNPSDFCPRDVLLVDCVTCISDFLNNPDVNQSLRSKCVQLLVNLSHDEELARCLHTTFDLTPVLVSLLLTHRPETTDPLALQCVEVLQRITYGQTMSTREQHITVLCTYLVKSIQVTENELTTTCVGVLANVCRGNPSLQTHAKNLDHVKSLYKRLVRLLANKVPEAVVYAQSVLTSLLLDDATADQLFTVQNINQTFEYVFNLLVKGQSSGLRAYTVDLLVDMIKSARVQQALTCFDHIERSIQRVLSLVETLKEKSVVKIFELLVQFCALPNLRSIITRCVFKHNEGHSDFVSVLVKWACVNGECLRANIPALHLLKSTLQVVLSTNSDLLTSPRLDLILRNIKTNVSTATNDHIKLRCQVMSSTLDLLLVLVEQDHLRSSILDYINATICCQILDYQYLHNTLGTIQYDTSFSLDNPDDWSEDGVTVALNLLIVMDKLKRSSVDLQQLTHSTLVDRRFTPLLAYGLTSTSSLLVQYGINLLSMASTLSDFPHIRLADAMAANVSSKASQFGEHKCPRHAAQAPPIKRQCFADITTQMTTNRLMTRGSSSSSAMDRKMSETDDAIESLIKSFKSGAELKDVKVTEIIDVYEHKLQTLQGRYRDLESLLGVKMTAMGQADRLIAQHSSRMAQAEAEISQMRGMLRVAEKNCEESKDTINNTIASRSELQQKLDSEQQRFESLTEDMQELQSTHNEQTEELKSVSQSLGSLKEEHNGLMNIHDMLTKHHDSLKQQHEVMKQQFTDTQEERRNISKHLKEHTSKLQEYTKSLKSLKLQHEETKKERDEFEEITDKLRSDLAKADAGRKKLENQLSSLEMVIQDKEKAQNSLKDELSKRAQIAALIHNLSSGNVSNFDTSGITK